MHGQGAADAEFPSWMWFCAVNPTVGKATQPKMVQRHSAPEGPGGCFAPSPPELSPAAAWSQLAVQDPGQAQTPLLPLPCGEVGFGHPGSSVFAKASCSWQRGSSDSLAFTQALISIPLLVKCSKTPKWPQSDPMPSISLPVVFGHRTKKLWARQPAQARGALCSEYLCPVPYFAWTLKRQVSLCFK